MIQIRIRYWWGWKRYRCLGWRLETNANDDRLWMLLPNGSKLSIGNIRYRTFLVHNDNDPIPVDASERSDHPKNGER